MHATTSFEERSAELLEDMCAERLGCPMAWGVARAGRVGTALVSNEEQIHNALEGICSRIQYDALLLLPDEEPDDWEEGHTLTEEMSWAVLRQLTQRAHKQYTDQLPELMDALKGHDGMMRMFAYKDTPEEVFNCYSMLASPVQNRAFSNTDVLEFWNGKTIDQLFSFVHAPYFENTESKIHPRNSRHYCFVATRNSDILAIPEDKFHDMKMWTLRAGQGRYVQRMHPSPSLPSASRFG
ncbi:MAG: hypothetical protein O3A81_01840 [bacterium]|nr:hypothetical protein [bacterium]